MCFVNWNMAFTTSPVPRTAYPLGGHSASLNFRTRRTQNAELWLAYSWDKMQRTSIFEYYEAHTLGYLFLLQNHYCPPLNHIAGDTKRGTRCHTRHTVPYWARGARPLDHPEHMILLLHGFNKMFHIRCGSSYRIYNPSLQESMSSLRIAWAT